MSKLEWKVAVGPDEISAVYEPATSGEEVGVFVGAHGAGGNMADRSVLATANAMRKQGIGVVRFNFVYKEKKSSRPDAMPKCMDVIRAVVARVRSDVAPARVVIGGRSMGGRAASMLAAEGFDADGLLLLAYPLHPPGRPDKLRDAHLPDIRMPVLAFSGTRDPFISRELMESVLERVTAPWDMQWVESADHSFHVPKSSGQTDAGWLRRLRWRVGRGLTGSHEACQSAPCRSVRFWDDVSQKRTDTHRAAIVTSTTPTIYKINNRARPLPCDRVSNSYIRITQPAPWTKSEPQNPRPPAMC